jgi:hypothetical protein
MCDQSGSSPKISSCDEITSKLFKTHEIARSCIQHENILIGERVSRTLVVQAFLLGGYGLLVNARISCITAKPSIDALIFLTTLMLPLIALMGVFTARSAREGVLAAERAIGCVRKNWEIFVCKNSKAFSGIDWTDLAGAGQEFEACSVDERKKRKKQAEQLYYKLAEQHIGWSLGLPGLTDGSHPPIGGGGATGVLQWLLYLWAVVFALTIYSVTGLAVPNV